MDVKQIQIVQGNHAERLSRLEKRQADDAAIKSAWNSPFPSALGGPLQMPPTEMFDDFEEQGQSLLGSLHLDAEDEPTRRGAASRANSVRFDESALQSSSWAQNGRHSGDFGPIRPGSGLGHHGLMERSLSHKSDGRHSSAGHSVHSHHSVASGRGSSLGLDTTFTPGGQEEDSPVGMTQPSPGFFILGSVPAIVRCWLTDNFAHDTLLYADICTGSQRSVIDYSLVKELNLMDAIRRDLDGVYRIRLHVYLTEATVSHGNTRAAGPAPQMPSLACAFEVAGMDQIESGDSKRAIRVFIGSEALREHSADVLFSQNRMTLYSSEREKLSVPFVRPEDNGIFKHIRTMTMSAEKPKLNAAARPFVLGEMKQQATPSKMPASEKPEATPEEPEPRRVATPASEEAGQLSEAPAAGMTASSASESGGESEGQDKEQGSARPRRTQHESAQTHEVVGGLVGPNGGGLRTSPSTPKHRRASTQEPADNQASKKKESKKMRKGEVDYQLYLVTDSTPAILGVDRDLCAVVEAALAGGVTVVQYRDKTSDTGALVATARRLHAATRRRGVPLLINDRVDVALAVGCEGVHIGQDDMDLATARRLLGDDAIIGVTVSNAEETAAACAGGADYLGIGTVFATPTKENTKSIIGVDGVQRLLRHIASLGSDVRTVCIGGINASNAARVAWQSAVPPGPSPGRKALDGVAVVSAVMAAADPAAAAAGLLRALRAPPAFARAAPTEAQRVRTPDELLAAVPDVVRAVAETRPLSHNMTNLVVQNLAANVALSVGASPIMANYGEEAADLARLGGALVINMGTVTPDGLANYLKALRAYNDAGRPVVFDPVGAGATAVRRSATRQILGGGYVDVLKGNHAEMLACMDALGIEYGDESARAQPQQQQRGVDSGPAADALVDGAALRELAALRRCVVVMTGATDLVTAGGRVYAVANGHALLGAVTGTGCCLGTAISAAVAHDIEDDDGSRGGGGGGGKGGADRLAAVLAALLHYNIAAERAAERVDDVRGPGTFVPAFLDELCAVRDATARGDLAWLRRARLSVLC
ncbi:TMP-TENI-domain-containing protein [Xylariaceae sp. FL0804]|nr:TMP-TENI-domain-containing protein [Xylariaceae sp. FL0804]